MNVIERVNIGIADRWQVVELQIASERAERQGDIMTSIRLENAAKHEAGEMDDANYVPESEEELEGLLAYYL